MSKVGSYHSLFTKSSQY